MDQYTEQDRYSKRFRIAGWLFIGMSAVTLLLSLSTRGWTAYSARLVDVTNTNISVGPGYSGIPKTSQGFRGSYSVSGATYTYVIDGTNFSGSTICICIPIGIDIPSADIETAVYVGPLGSALPVLVRGPHFVLPALVALIGGLLLFGAKKVEGFYGDGS